MKAAGSTVWRHYAVVSDGQGNVAQLIRLDTGKAVANFRYGAYGLNNIQGITTGSADALDKAQINCSLRYQSKWQHQSGLVNFGFRFYNPATARWMSRDPLGEAGGLNLYGYAGGDPINHFDPNGLSIFDDWKASINKWLFGDGKKPCASDEAGDDEFNSAQQLADNNQRGIKVSATLAKEAYNGIYNEAPKQLMFGAAAKGIGIFAGAARAVNAGSQAVAIGDSTRMVPSLMKVFNKLPRGSVQEAENLILQFSKGDINPGIGNGSLKSGGIFYLRGRNGARVFMRLTGQGQNQIYEILGYADKSNEDQVIGLIKRNY